MMIVKRVVKLDSHPERSEGSVAWCTTLQILRYAQNDKNN